MFKIKLDTFQNVKYFVSEINFIESDAIIRSQDRKYAVDAKSLLGIFSLDLSKILILDINGDETNFIEKIKKFGIYIESVEE